MSPDEPEVITLFACTRTTVRCSECGSRAGFKCTYALRGPATGKTCGRDLCERCAGEKLLCGPHSRLSAAAK